MRGDGHTPGFVAFPFDHRAKRAQGAPDLRRIDSSAKKGGHPLSPQGNHRLCERPRADIKDSATDLPTSELGE